jgi:ankyrin repeat protein
MAEVQLLLGAGANPALEGMTEFNGRRYIQFPLTAASLAGHIEVVRLLLTLDGVDHQQLSTDIGCSAFFCACFGGHLEVAQLLLSLGGVDVNQARTDGGETPLCVACRRGRTEVVAMLLAHAEIDVNQARTDDGAAPLYTACNHGRTEVVGLLLTHNDIAVNQARTDEGDGVTPLIVACSTGHSEVVKLLLNFEGINVNLATSGGGESPLYAACENGHAEVVTMLLACEGVAVNQACTDDGAVPLYIACYGGHIEVVKLLLACDDIDVNAARTDTGATSLHDAAWRGHLAIAQQLVVFGADMTAIDFEASTALKYASDREHVELAAWLEAVNQWSRLRMAAGCRFHTAVTIQLKQGRMDPDATLSWTEMQLAYEAATSPATELPWRDAWHQGMPCPLTAKLIKAATRGWAPTTHWMHHSNIRTAVCTVLLISERLHVEQALASPPPPALQPLPIDEETSTADVLPILPPEMWLATLRFLLRRHWAVSPLLPAPQ